MSQTPLAVHLILLAGQICFASLPVFGRLAMQGGTIPPAGIVLVRMTGGAIIFTAIAINRRTWRFDPADFWKLLGCAFLGVAANQELFVQGLARSTATNASVLGATIPVFTVLAAMVLGREPLRVRRVAGIAIACAGAVMFVGLRKISTDREHALGSAMILVNAVSYGTFLVVVRPLSAKYDPITLLSLLFALGVPMVAPLGIAAWLDAPPLATGGYAYLAFLVAVPTVAAYSLVQIALRRAESTLVAAYIYLQPVFAAAGAVLLLDESVTLRMVGWGLVVMFGVWLAARSRP